MCVSINVVINFCLVLVLIMEHSSCTLCPVIIIPCNTYLSDCLSCADKPVEQAKVTFDYDADNDDELTIRVGDVVEILNKDVDQQEGWWEVRVCTIVLALQKRSKLF